MLPFYPGLIAFAGVVALVPLVRALALKFDFVDHPGGRKKHDDPVPPVGGLAVFPIFMGVVAFFVPGGGEQHAALFSALFLLLIVGALDDYRGVPARIKFLVQFAAALIIVIGGGAQIHSMENLFGFGPFGLGIFSVPFSVISVVLLINAVNLMDGLDGLAGGMGFVVSAWLAAACFLVGAAAHLTLSLILMGVLGGFLVYNMRGPWRKRASVFLGDSGSLCLGLMMAWLCITVSVEASAIPPIGIAWLLALPIMDTCGQFARRVTQGRHPFDADHNHFHHHFVNAGLSPGRATAAILGIVFLTGLIGVGGSMAGVPQAVLTYPWIALLFVHIYMCLRPHRFRRLIQAVFNPGNSADAGE